MIVGLFPVIVYPNISSLWVMTLGLFPVIVYRTNTFFVVKRHTPTTTRSDPFGYISGQHILNAFDTFLYIYIYIYAQQDESFFFFFFLVRFFE